MSDLQMPKLSGLNQRLGFGSGARRRRRRGNHSSRFEAAVVALEQRFLLTAGPVKMQPDTPGIMLKDVLYQNKNVPLKTITLNNNSNDTVYPVIYNSNEQQDVVGTKDTNPNYGKSIYDPFDNWKEDYRGYVGYGVKQGGKNVDYLGLPAHSQVTIAVPLVFWNGGRMAIATDGSLLETENNAFNYHNGSQRYTTDSDNIHEANTTGGVVQWYHWNSNHLAQGISTAAPAQLIEQTIKDVWLGTPKGKSWNLPTWGDLQKQAPQPNETLINYDVSYVDSMTLPVAMEAPDAKVTFITNQNDPHFKQPYGWTGADIDRGAVQTAITNFTTNKTGDQGTYFGGAGFDHYYYPDSLADAGVSIPAAINLFGCNYSGPGFPRLCRRLDFNRLGI